MLKEPGGDAGAVPRVIGHGLDAAALGIEVAEVFRQQVLRDGPILSAARLVLGRHYQVAVPEAGKGQVLATRRPQRLPSDLPQLRRFRRRAETQMAGARLRVAPRQILGGSLTRCHSSVTGGAETLDDR